MYAECGTKKGLTRPWDHGKGMHAFARCKDINADTVVTHRGGLSMLFIPYRARIKNIPERSSSDVNFQF